MRAAREMEYRGYTQQLRGVALQAHGIAAQRRGSLLALAGLQKIECAVANTKSDVLHDLVSGTAGLLIRDLPEGYSEDLGDAAEVIAESIAAKAKAMERRSAQESAIAEAAEAGLEAAGGPEGESPSVDPTAVATAPRKHTAINTGAFRAIFPVLGEDGSMNFPHPRVQTATGWSEVHYGSSFTVAGTKGTKKAHCPLCSYTAAPEGVLSHIRSSHTKEIWVCPNKLYCQNKKKVFCSHNSDSMKRHFGEEGPLSAEVRAIVSVKKEVDEAFPSTSKTPEEGEPME